MTSSCVLKNILRYCLWPDLKRFASATFLFLVGMLEYWQDISGRRDKVERHVMKRKRLHITNRIKGIAGCILLAAGFALLFISRLSQEFAHWYSTKVYPVWVGTTGRLMNLFPFSVSEVLLYIMIVIILLSAGVLIIKEVRRKAGKKEACSWGMGVFLLAASLFFLYVFCLLYTSDAADE